MGYSGFIPITEGISKDLERIIELNSPVILTKTSESSNNFIEDLVSTEQMKKVLQKSFLFIAI